MVAIYRVCEHSYNIECANRVAGWQCANRVAVCEQGGSVRTGWQCANRVAIYRVCEHGNIECAVAGWQCANMAVCEHGGNI